MQGNRRSLVKRLLLKKGQTYANEAGIDLEKNTPAVLFQHLYMSLLLSARIPAGNALEAEGGAVEKFERSGDPLQEIHCVHSSPC